jgi:hypothetical protein
MAMALPVGKRLSRRMKRTTTQQLTLLPRLSAVVCTAKTPHGLE